MNKSRTERIVSVIVLSLTALVLIGGVAAAQNVQGVINGRSGATFTLQTQGSGNVVVVLTPSTQVDEIQGLFKARKKEMTVTALVPGLQVQVQGSYNAQGQLVADQVKFKGNALENAQDIQAGVAPVQQQAQAAQQQADAAAQQAQVDQQQIQAQQQKLREQQRQLVAEQQATAAHEEQIEANQAEIAANKAAIAAANKRFGELGDYNILGEVTILFANGSTQIEAEYKPKLQQLAQQAKGITAYIIQVQGYASKVGSAALNQRLSAERAQNVLDLLEQQDGIPLTNVLAPGAMGTTGQVAPDATAEGQAENRRVVVRILQNKGIAGT